MTHQLLSLRAGAIALWILASAPALAAQPLPRHKPRVTEDEADVSAPARAPQSPKKSKKAKRLAPVEASARTEPGPPPTLPAPADIESKPAGASAKVIDITPRQADEGTKQSAPAPVPAEPGPHRLSGAGDDEYPAGDDEEPRRRSSGRTGPDDEVPAGFTEISVAKETPEGDESAGDSDKDRGVGLSTEFVAGILHLDGGTSSTTLFGWGIAADWRMGRLFSPGSFLHENLFLELSWLHAGTSYGTTEVTVGQTQNHFSAAILLGYTLASAYFYGKVGPSIFVIPVTYEVQGTNTSYLGIRTGLQYGVGVRSSLYFSEALGVALRLELNGYRRGYLNDLFFCGGVGVAF